MDDTDDRDVRKRRRRSVRNIRRQSGVVPMNFNVLDDDTDARPTDVAVSQSDGNQQDMYGSLWWESQEPVVKKRKRRSFHVINLASIEQTIEEPSDRNNHDNKLVGSNDFQKVPNDTESSFEIKADCHNVISLNDVRSELNTYNNSEQAEMNKSKHKGVEQNDCFPCTAAVDVCDESNNSGQESRVNMNNNSFISEIPDLYQPFRDDAIINTPPNKTDLDRKSPADGNLSKISPASMSPDFPVSPNSAMHLDTCDESFLGIVKEGKERDDRGLSKSEMTPDADISADSKCDVNFRSPVADRASDLSHSDKENSVVNDGASLNITPQGKVDAEENTSPGFMSLCKAFAGKVVNFVKTSPSYLTGAFSDNSACASPPLKSNTSLNHTPKDYSPHCDEQSDIVMSLYNLHNKMDKKAATAGPNVDNKIDAKLKDTEDGNVQSGTRTEYIVHPANVIKPASTLYSTILGSAKKSRDRKTFFETFNAVSDELNRDKRKGSCTEEAEDKIMDKTNCLELRGKDQNTEQSIEHVNEIAEKIDQNNYMDIAPSEGMEDTNSLCSKVDSVDGIVDNLYTNGNVTNTEKCGEIEHLNCDLKVNEVNCTEQVNVTPTLNEIDDDSVLTAIYNRAGEETDSIAREHTSEGLKSVVNVEQKKEEISVVEAKTEASQTAKNKLKKHDNLEKHKTKRRRRKALDIPNVAVGGEIFSHQKSEMDFQNAETDTLMQEQQETNFDVCKKTETTLTNLNEPEELSIEHHSNSLARVTNYMVKPTDMVQIRVEKEIETECDGNSKKSTKTRKNRRKSFGIQSIYQSQSQTESENNSGKAMCTSKDNCEITYTANADEVDGLKEFRAQECQLEKRIADMDLRNDPAESESVNSSIRIRKDMLEDLHVIGNLDIQNMPANNTEKRKRGRRRKSANLNDILKKRQPKLIFVSQVQDENFETDWNEKYSMSELTNEVSQVQISDNEKLITVEPEISVESLMLPGDQGTTVEQGSAPKRRRRRSAEAASLKLSMMNIEESPGTSDSASPIEDKKRRRKSASISTSKTQKMLVDQDNTSPSGDVSVYEEETTTCIKAGRKRKHKEMSDGELEKLYRNKNFVKPEEKRPWQTVLENPTNPVEIFGKKKLQRHIEFERPTQMKLRRRLQRAVKNGWDPKKRKRNELEDDYVQMKLADVFSELDETEDGPDSLQNKLRSIIETK